MTEWAKWDYLFLRNNSPHPLGERNIPSVPAIAHGPIVHMPDRTIHRWIESIVTKPQISRDQQKSSPRGRVALLGIAQRQIRVSRAHIPVHTYRRKPLPTSIKTLGDLIQIKRYEKRLTLWQLAQKMGIATSLVCAWEKDTDRPNQQQLELLGSILRFQATND